MTCIFDRKSVAFDSFDTCCEIDRYTKELKQQLQRRTVGEAERYIKCARNYEKMRKETTSRYEIHPGDIVFVDYGNTYAMEVNSEHFGLVMATCSGKIFVIPMTSSQFTYDRAYDKDKNPYGKKNLFQLGKVGQLEKESVLFLNDAKFINPARVIFKLGNIGTESNLYKEISDRLDDIIHGNDDSGLN